MKENESLLQENQILKKELEKLKPIIENFIFSFEKLQIILSNQKVIFKKTRLGFNPHKNIIFLKNFFVKTPPTPSSNVIYFCCRKLDHKSYTCDFKKNKQNKVKKVWISKGIIMTNLKGSKKTWIPKNTT